MTVGDHDPRRHQDFRGQQFWDGIATFSYLAALTTNIRFFLDALVLPLYHPSRSPSVMAWSTCSVVGASSSASALATSRRSSSPLAGRSTTGASGPTTPSAACVPESGKRIVNYTGTYYAFENLVVQPHAVQEHVPFWIGGHSKRALRRALELGDGWVPPPVGFKGPSADDLRRILDEYDVPAGFVIVATAGGALDPEPVPDETQEQMQLLEAAGGNVTNVRFVNVSLAHYLEQLEVFASLVGLSPA